MAASPWLSQLDCTKNGPRPNLSNAVMVLQHDPTFGPDNLWYDEFKDAIFIRNSAPRPLRDDDAYRVTVYMQEVAQMSLVQDHVIRKALELVARQRTRNVLMDWAKTLHWDGIPRIEHAFEDYWGAEGTEYTLAASKNFFVGMMARVRNPGCKLDTMVVFEGPQGIRKSSALAVLGGEWYGITHEAVGTKDFLQGMRGKLLLEIAELQSFSKADVRAVKNMLSTQADDYRPSYGRNVVRFPRVVVFAGTTNVDEWATDDTGGRRFWPIRCGEIDIVKLTEQRSQLFAEAQHALSEGATWWDMPEGTTAVQAARQHHDEWTETVLNWAETKMLTEDCIHISDLIVDGLKIRIADVDLRSQLRVASILRVAGWRNQNRRSGKRVVKVWAPAESV